jgi:hypothetical protein
MVVRRKGRGVFRAEVALREDVGMEGDGFMVRRGKSRLEDGFDYVGWINEDEDMARGRGRVG